MTEFLAELRRRHIYRIGGIYVVVAWGITQVLDVLSQMFALPDWIAQPSLVVLTIGFPVVLIVAWTIVGAAQVTDTPTELRKATATDWVLAGALIMVIGLIAYQQLSTNNAEITATAHPENAASDIAGEIVEDVADRLPNSVAVLPFDNVSPDPNDAYFAVGIHDEVLRKLQRLRNLSVISRASVMKYADTAMSIPEIANELNVETIMSGSVRLAGDQVLVNAELIDGQSNLTVWSDQYPGNLSDIFGIQADIAMNIANALQAEFSIDEQQRIEVAPTDSPEAYALFLRAVALRREGLFGSEARRAVVQDYLDQAITLDSNFALAHAWKALVYQFSKSFDPVAPDNWPVHRRQMNQLTEMHAEIALSFDPGLGVAHTAFARTYGFYGSADQTRMASERALQLSPNDPDVLNDHAWFLFLSEPHQALTTVNRAVALDPNNATLHQALSYHFQRLGRYEEASEAARSCLALAVGGGAGCLRPLASSEYGRGDYDAAIDAMREAERTSAGGYSTFAYLARGYGLIGLPEDAQRAFQRVMAISTETYIDPSIWAWAYMGIGDYAEAFNRFSEAAENPELIQYQLGAMITIANVWNDPVLEEPKWVELRSSFVSRN